MTKYEKVLRVIQSCHTLEQLGVARRYLSLALPNDKERLLHLVMSREDMLKLIGGINE